MWIFHENVHITRSWNASTVTREMTFTSRSFNEVLRDVLMFYIKDVDLRVQTWENVHFRLMYQEKLLQGSCLRRPPEANDIAGVYAVISGGEKNIRKIEKAIFGARFDLFV